MSFALISRKTLKTSFKDLEAKLNDTQNGLQGYVELKSWIEKESGKVFKYNYCHITV